MDTEELITIETAARSLGTTRRAVEIAMQHGKLPYVKVLGRRAILRVELEAYRIRNKRGRPKKTDMALVTRDAVTYDLATSAAEPLPGFEE